MTNGPSVGVSAEKNVGDAVTLTKFAFPVRKGKNGLPGTQLEKKRKPSSKKL